MNEFMTNETEQSKTTQEEILNMEFECGTPDLIPQGSYNAKVIDFDKSPFMGKEKLYINMVIASGDYSGVELFMAMNLPKRKRCGSSSKFYKSWFIANNNSSPIRPDRMTPRVFKDASFKVEVRTVYPKSEEGAPYSVVDKLLARID